MRDPIEDMRQAEMKESVEAKKKLEKDRKKFEKTVKNALPKEAKKGSVVPLKFWPDEALTTPCTEVESFDSELRDLIHDMAMTMYMCGGVGIAANQVGVLKRVFVCDIRSNMEGKSEFRVFVNPTVLSASEGTERIKEGCLSFPGMREVIERPSEVEVRAFTHKGKAFEVKLDGWPARVFQHEFDHLNGETWLDLMGKLQRKQAMKKLKKLDRGLELEERSKKKRRR